MKRILIAMIVLTAFGCEGMNRAESVRKMNEGLDAYKRGLNVDAIDALKEASRIDPGYSEPAYFLGQIYHVKMKELDNAERFYREAQDRDKDNPQIAYRLGSVLGERAKWAEAESMQNEATRLDVKFAKAWFRKGLAQEQQEKYVEAVESYGKSINANARMKMEKSDPGGAAYHALGKLYERYGQYEKSVAVYENGLLNNDLSTSPNRPAQLFAGRGVAQIGLGKFSDAASSFGKALDIDGGHNTSIFNLAVADMALKKTDAAIKGFERFKNRADRKEDAARIAAAQGFIQQIKTAQEKEKAKQNEK